jgi:hypothetical protein
LYYGQSTAALSGDIMKDLFVWWIPQVPMKPFKVPVESVQQGCFLLDTLADYDRFQYENRIKPDYANAGGLMMRDPDDPDGEELVDWYDEETGMDDPFEYLEYIASNK